MDALQITEFNKLITAINQTNNRDRNPLVTYILISGSNLIVKQGLSLYDLSKFDYIIVLGDYLWDYGVYVNKSAILIGFFNKNLELIDSIPVNDNIRISGIEFECYKSSFYNARKPIMICQKTEGEIIELRCDGGWDTAFQDLYDQAIELDK